MSRPGFWREAGVALALSLAGALAWNGLAWFTSPAAAMRFTIAVLGLVYAALQLRGLETRVGGVLVIAAWLALVLALFAFNPPLSGWLLAQAAAIWVLRCWAFHTGVFTALGDAAIGLFAVVAGVVVIHATHSVFLACWSFFLVQALFVFIPDSRQSAPRISAPGNEDRFARAQRTAEAALQRLANRH